MAQERQSSDDMNISAAFNGMPVWIRAAFVLGAPTVAAGYLMWLISGSLTQDVRAMRESFTTHAIQTAALVEKVTESRATSDAKVDVLIRISQTQCVNAATDVMQRRNCIEAGGR